MPSWTANFAVASEVTQPFIDLVLSKLLDYLRSQNQHLHQAQLGPFGTLAAELTRLTANDIRDVPPIGGVQCDFEAQVEIRLRLFGFIRLNATLVFLINDVEINMSRTPAGLPKGVVLSITPTMSISVTFPGARGLTGFLLNRIVGPLVSTGVWLAFRIIRRVEVPIWELVDVFGALGIRYASSSPLLTAQTAISPSSVLLASDFNLTNPTEGTATQLQHFLPANTNIGIVLHDRVLAAAVQIAFAKGWAPTHFEVAGWKIYLNYIKVEFEQDTVVASGSLKAKRGSCWCRVKVRIQFTVAVEPKVVVAPPPNPDPRLEFKYAADINVEISTSGMLVVLGVLMFTPLFLSLTISMSFLINLLLDQFLPYQTSWSRSGLTLTIEANASVSGFIPFSMSFPLELTGQGAYSLSRFQQFSLPGGSTTVNVSYANDSLAIQKHELRAAVNLS